MNFRIFLFVVLFLLSTIKSLSNQGIFNTDKILSEREFYVTLFIKVAKERTKNIDEKRKWNSILLRKVAEKVYDIGILKYNISMYEWLLLIEIESDFVYNCKSEKGALGLFQVMPNTAKEICKSLKIKYNKEKLKRDPIYNSIIGMCHYKNLKSFYTKRHNTVTAYNYGYSCSKYVKNYIGIIKKNIVVLEKNIVNVSKN